MQGFTAMSNESLPAGTYIGDYCLRTLLRREDSGAVYETTHAVLPRRAALKIAHEAEFTVQLLREACTLEGLDHPGIPRVYECGTLGDGRTWIAIELLDGLTVSDAIANGPASVPEVVYLLRDVGEILAIAHRAGVIHRQVTSATVVRTSGRRFPYALRNWSDAYTLEVELDGELPPGLVDERDDVYALGAIAFRALVGEVATDGASCIGRRPSAPLELAQLIDQMCRSDRDGRPSAAEVRDRATALAAAIELVPQLQISEKPRWTPAYGVGADKLPPASLPEGSGEAIELPPPVAPVAPVAAPAPAPAPPVSPAPSDGEQFIRFKPRA